MPQRGGDEAGWEWLVWRDRLSQSTITNEGPGWRSTGSGYGQSSDSPILGYETGAEAGQPGQFGSLVLNFAGSANKLTSTDQSAGDMQQKTKGSVEFWFKKTANPGSDGLLWVSPEVTGVAAALWYWQLNTTGTVSFTTRVAGPVGLTQTTAALANDTWYHLCAVRDGTNQILYVNGVAVDTDASTAAWEQSSATVFMYVTNPGTGVTASFAEMAVYPGNGLSAARVLAHYEAGTARGFAIADPGVRAGDALDMVQNHAPRSFQPGSRDMVEMFSAGRPVLDHIRAAVACEKPDGMFFCTAGGTLFFLAQDHRTKSPYNTTQVTFGDEGTAGQVPYLDLDTDYSDSWIANIWSVSKGKEGSITQTVSDATSIAAYDELAQTVSDLPIRLNADAGDDRCRVSGQVQGSAPARERDHAFVRERRLRGCLPDPGTGGAGARDPHDPKGARLVRPGDVCAEDGGVRLEHTGVVGHVSARLPALDSRTSHREGRHQELTEPERPCSR